MSYRFPAEFEPHDATWIAWPHHEPDWPGKIAPIPWVYAEIVRVLHRYERVEILCHDELVKADAEAALAAHGVAGNYRLHVVPNDRVWLRDSAPTVVQRDDGGNVLVNWRFNAWAKYQNFSRDARVGEAVAAHHWARSHRAASRRTTASASCSRAAQSRPMERARSW